MSRHACSSLRALRANESFVHLFKGGGVQGRSPCPRSAERGTLLCLLKRRRGSKGEPSPGVPPFLYSFACAPFYWAVVDGPCCLSTPFLWCLPKETVSSRQRKALFYTGGSTIRVSATSRWSGRSSPDLGEGLVLIFGACAFEYCLPFKSICWAGRRSRLLGRRRWGRSRPWCRR